MGTPNVRLINAMNAAGFKTPTDVSTRVRDVNRNTITSHANGNRPLSRKAALKYAKLFGCSAGWLLYEEGPPPGSMPVETEAWLDRITHAATEAVISGVDSKDVVNALLDVINTIREIAERHPDRIPLAKEVVRRAREQSRNKGTEDKGDTEEPR